MPKKRKQPLPPGGHAYRAALGQVGVVVYLTPTQRERLHAAARERGQSVQQFGQAALIERTAQVLDGQ